MSFSCAPILFDSYACASDIADGGKCGILVKPFDDKTFAKKLSDWPQMTRNVGCWVTVHSISLFDSVLNPL